MKRLGTVISLATLLMGLGVSAAAALVFTPLVLVNGWVGGPMGTAQPAVGLKEGIVYLKGAMSSGTAAQAFTLPVGFRPTHPEYITVDLCNANKGRLFISPNGVTIVHAEKTFAQAQCFTSLDGVSFAP